MALHPEGDPDALFLELGLEPTAFELHADSETARLQALDSLLEQSSKFDLTQLKIRTRLTLESTTDGTVTLQIIQDRGHVNTDLSRWFVARVLHKSEDNPGFEAGYVKIHGPSLGGYDRKKDRHTVAKDCDLGYTPVDIVPYLGESEERSGDWLGQMRRTGRLLLIPEVGVEVEVIDMDTPGSTPQYFANVSGGYYGPNKTPIFPAPGQNTVS